MVIILMNIWFQFTFYRVDTVLGSDRVIVMSDGKAIEIGHPNILLQDPNSEFSKHVAANWVATLLYQEWEKMTFYDNMLQKTCCSLQIYLFQKTIPCIG